MTFRASGAFLAGVLLLAAAPSWAQTLGGSRVLGWCGITAKLSASAVCGHKAYERWGDGSPARADGLAARYRTPRYFTGAYGRFYGFGR